MIKLADSDDTRPSAPYLDLLAARRAQRAEDAVLAYQRNRERLESFEVYVGLAETVLRSRLFSQGSGRRRGWRSAENGGVNR